MTGEDALPKAGKYDVAPDTRYVETAGPVVFDHIDFDPQAVESAIEDIERAGDRIFCVTTNEQGSSEKVNSATQSNLESQGSNARIADLIARFELPFSAMAAFSCEILYDQYLLWAPFDRDIKTQKNEDGFEGPAPGSPTREDFKGARKWQANGRNPHDTPMAQLANFQQLLVMARTYPEANLDIYNIARGFIATLGMAGSRNFQRERPIAQPTGPGAEGAPGQPAPGGEPRPPSVPGAPAQPGMAGPEGPAMPAQQTEQGQALPPIAESSVRAEKPGGMP
jgi:hypothetical protein